MKYEPQLHVVLHEPEIPQNTGNVGRSCLACGAKLWLVRPLGYRLDEKRLRRAGLDYWQHLEWEAVDNWPELLRHLPESRMWFFSKTGRRPYTEARFEVGDALVFGSETKGLPEPMLKLHPNRTLRIPIREPVRSLNLASAAAVAAFEAVRQWNPPAAAPGIQPP